MYIGWINIINYNIRIIITLDFISKTPFGTFFAVIGSSFGFYDANTSPYVGLLLHFATGTVAGNLLGQGALFWNRLIPFGIKRGTILGIITGISLWLILFLPLTVYITQPKLGYVQFFSSKPIRLCNSTTFPRAVPSCSNRILFFPFDLWNNFRINCRETHRIKISSEK